jgi:hypothetical protein
MPNRLVSLAILLFWTVAAGSLFTRDVLPTLIIGTPPDLRTVTHQAENRPRQTRWSILVVDQGQGVNFRAVGQLVTQTVRKRDGYVRMTSEAWFDSAELLKGTVLQSGEGGRLEVVGDYEIDSTGNLYHFRTALRDGPPPRGDMLTLEGDLEDNSILVRAKGVLPILNWTRPFPYQPRGMVQNTMGPLDRMPGLHVGQRWETRVVSPLTGHVQIGRVEVTRKRSIYWDDKLVSTLEVVTRMAPFSAKTWVRPDGLVLRQEVPLLVMNLTLLLERVPDNATEQGPTP